MTCAHAIGTVKGRIGYDSKVRFRVVHPLATNAEVG
jgi:hypothetical protein